MAVVNPEHVTVGQIVKPHGVKGEMIVDVYTDFPEKRFQEGARVLVEEEDRVRPLTVVRARPHKDRLILRVEEIEDIDEVESLRDRLLVIPETETEELEEDEVYGFELEGYEVLDRDGRSMGTITNVEFPFVNPVLEIECPGRGTVDFPAAPELVEGVDRDKRHIRLRFPPGWEKLIRSPSEKGSETDEN